MSTIENTQGQTWHYGKEWLSGLVRGLGSSTRKAETRTPTRLKPFHLRSLPLSHHLRRDIGLIDSTPPLKRQ